MSVVLLHLLVTPEHANSIYKILCKESIGMYRSLSNMVFYTQCQQEFADLPDIHSYDAAI